MTADNNIATATATAIALAAYDTDTATYKAVADALDKSRKAMTDAESVAKSLAAVVLIEGVDADLPIAIAGSGELVQLGNFTAEAIADMDAPGGFMVSIVGCRGIEGGEDGKKKNGLIGIAIYPQFDVATILDHDKGTDYLQRLAEKEMGLVAFRNLRIAPGAPQSELAHGAAIMPASLGDFIERERQAGAGSIYAVFNDNWASFRQVLQNNPATQHIVKHLPAKADMLKCIRSKSFAESHYAMLEEADWFVKLGQAMANVIDNAQTTAADAGEECDIEGDPALIAEWLKGRDALDLETKATQAVASMDLDLAAFGVTG